MVGMIPSTVSRNKKRSAYRRPTPPTIGDPNGRFEQRCAWMRARQAAKALHVPKVITLGEITGQVENQRLAGPEVECLASQARRLLAHRNAACGSL